MNRYITSTILGVVRPMKTMATAKVLALFFLTLLAETLAQEEPKPTALIEEAMKGQNYAVIILDFFNVTESDEANCMKVDAGVATKMPKNCRLVLEPKLCFLDEKNPTATSEDCLGMEVAKIERAPGFGGTSGHPYKSLDCIGVAVKDGFGVQSKKVDNEHWNPVNTFSDINGCVFWAVSLGTDESRKSKINRGYFLLEMKVKQLVQSDADANAITDGFVKLSSRGFHLAPYHLHLAFYNGNACATTGGCVNLEARFGIFTEDVAHPRATATMLKPKVQAYIDN